MASFDLVARVLPRLPAESRGWFGDAIDRASHGGAESSAFQRDWGVAGRKAGREALGGEGALAQWGVDEATRGALLERATRATPVDQCVPVVEELFRTGGLREKSAVARMLALLPGPERFVSLAADAMRDNTLDVLKAVACDNPFTEALLPPLLFNQLVVKCLFNGLPVARVCGLPARRTPELRRMVQGFVSERLAAGRSVPADVALIWQGDAHAAV